jgi:tyrosyl-tRNA synthetase
MTSADFGAGIPAWSLLQKAGLAETNSEARRLIRGGGAKLNDQKLDDENLNVQVSAAVNGMIKLSAGKKRHAIVIKIS